jgi:hypothetical protein
MNAPLTAAQLPDADVSQAKKAEDKAREDGKSIERHGGWGTFIVLAFVFVFLQILGVIFGFRWGFAGRESSAAHRAIGAGRYSTYSDVREHYKEIADTAQAKLEQLQQRLMYRNSESGTDGIHTSKTFRDFMEEERRNDTLERTNERQHEVARAYVEQAPVQPAAVNTPASVPQGTVNAEPTLGEVLRHLETLVDKDAKKAYLSTLSPALFDDVAAALKAQKEERARREAEAQQRRAADLDSLLD